VGAGRLKRPVGAETIVTEVCRELSVDLPDFMGKGRHKRVVLARSLVASLCRKLTTMSFPEIARAMGRSNHSTIITAQRRVDRQLAEDTGKPLSAELAASHAGSTLRELAAFLTRKIQQG
jgi:chromosomal replication initiator protein